MVPLLKEVREGYTVDIELKGTHATTHVLHLRLHFNIPGNVSETDKRAFEIWDPWFFFLQTLLYILSSTSSSDFAFECAGGDGNNIILKCFFFGCEIEIKETLVDVKMYSFRRLRQLKVKPCLHASFALHSILSLSAHPQSPFSLAVCSHVTPFPPSLVNSLRQLCD